jgi:hypothetical protein
MTKKKDDKFIAQLIMAAASAMAHKEYETAEVTLRMLAMQHGLEEQVYRVLARAA